MAGYVTPYHGASGGLLPAGYQEALTLPGQYLARGAEQFTQNFQAAKERSRQAQLADKAAFAMYDALAPTKDAEGNTPQHPFGVTRDQLAAMSRTDRIGLVKGSYDSTVLKNAMAQAQQEQQLNTAKIEEAKRQRAAEDALAAAMQSAGTEGVSQPNPVSPVLPPIQYNAQSAPTPDRLMRALAANPKAVNAPNYAGALRAMGAGADQPFFRPGDTNFALPGVSSMLRIPLGPNQAALIPNEQNQGKAVAITGPNGEPLGYGLPNRSGVQPLSQAGKIRDVDKYNRLSRQLDRLITAQGSAFMPQAFENYQKQIDAVSAQLQSLEEPPVPAAAPAPSAPGPFDAELKLAQEAISAGAPRATVAAKFKERTGKEFPK